MKSIRSRDNPFYKDLARISGSARHRSKSGLTLIDGAHLLAAYLDCGNRPRHILLNAAAAEDDEITRLLQQAVDVPIAELEEKLFGGISELKTPGGIMALIDIPLPQATIADSRFAVFLEDIQDPGNLGSMLRSAAAAGCDSVFLSGGCADAWSPKVLRAAMGGHFALCIHERQDLPDVANSFDGARFAASLRAPASLYDCDLRGKIAFLIGNEGAGAGGGCGCGDV